MGYGVDEYCTKMSKSKGNVIDPLPIIEKYGADTFRFWSASEINLGYDFRCSEQKVETTKKFLSKLWNVSRFLSGFPILKSAKSMPADNWILSELHKLVIECKKGFDEFNFFIPATSIREFTWNLFAAHYIEMVKGRAYGSDFTEEERDAAIFTLHKVFSTILLLLAPITPFITDYLWQTLYSDNGIQKQKFPQTESHEDLTEFTKLITEFNSDVWNKKKERGLSLKDPIDITVPDKLKSFAKDLQAMHNLKNQ
jgi:valyl-tRNA synthetase